MVFIIIVCRETGKSRMISFESHVGWSFLFLSSFLCMDIIFQLANYGSILFINNTCSKLWNDFCNCKPSYFQNKCIILSEQLNQIMDSNKVLHINENKTIWLLLSIVQLIVVTEHQSICLGMIAYCRFWLFVESRWKW